VLLATAISSDDVISKKHAAIANNNVSILSCADGKGRVDLEKLPRILASEYQCNDLLIESGAELAGAMLSAGLIDEVLTYIAPKLLGSDARPLFSLPGMMTMSDQVELEFLDVVMLGKDCRMRSRVINAR